MSIGLAKQWNDVLHGTTDEVSSPVRLDLPSPRRLGRTKDRSVSSSKPIVEAPWCLSGEKHEPVSDIDSVAADV
jgi:hypothetical protein